jgi:hypothetical protein
MNPGSFESGFIFIAPNHFYPAKYFSIFPKN